jgi:hypothetical protein
MPRQTAGDVVYRATVTGTVHLKAWDYEARCWRRTGETRPLSVVVGPYSTPGTAKGAATTSARQVTRYGRAEVDIASIVVECGETSWTPMP